MDGRVQYCHTKQKPFLSEVPQQQIINIIYQYTRRQMFGCVRLRPIRGWRLDVSEMGFLLKEAMKKENEIQLDTRGMKYKNITFRTILWC